MRGDVVERDTVKQHTPGVGGWIALVSTALLTPATLVANVWLLWRYVPAQVAALAEFEMSLPLSTRITIAASSWFVRMLPFAIFASMLLGPLLLGAAIILMLTRDSWWRAARVFIVAGLMVSTVGCIVIIFVLTSIQAAYRLVGSGP